VAKAASAQLSKAEEVSDYPQTIANSRKTASQTPTIELTLAANLRGWLRSFAVGCGQSRSKKSAILSAIRVSN
jgi:hypothetical protein